jgi:hypothetical protein
MDYVVPAIEGWMGGRDELPWLYARAQEMRSIVEIGCWKGRSTHALLSGCPGPVFAVDHFKGSPNELKGAHIEATRRDIFPDFWANVGEFKNLVTMRMDSIEAAGFFREKSVDMVFIDGCHLREAVAADIKAWMPICRRLLCGHDTNVVKGALEDMKLNYKNEVGSIWGVAL